MCVCGCVCVEGSAPEAPGKRARGLCEKRAILADARGGPTARDRPTAAVRELQLDALCRRHLSRYRARFVATKKRAPARNAGRPLGACESMAVAERGVRSEGASVSVREAQLRGRRRAGPGRASPAPRRSQTPRAAAPHPWPSPSTRDGSPAGHRAANKTQPHTRGHSLQARLRVLRNLNLGHRGSTAGHGRGAP